MGGYLKNIISNFFGQNDKIWKMAFFMFFVIGAKRKLRHPNPPRYMLIHYRQWKILKKIKISRCRWPGYCSIALSRWILVPQLLFFPYGQKCEKCHFSDFVIFTKKIANNVFCKYSHYNLQKILSILGTWISQIPVEMTDLRIYWLLTPPHSHTL